MYNLLMKSSWYYNEWEDNQGRLYDVSFLAGRVFEYTAEAPSDLINGNPSLPAYASIP